MNGIDIDSPPRRPGRLNLRRLLAFGFGFVLAVPLIQTVCPLLHERPLAGVINQLKPMRASLNTWWDGELAKTLELNLTRCIGLRPTLVRVTNQFQLVFDPSPTSLDNSRVRVCRDNWLVEEGYIKKFTDPPCELEESEVAQFVSELKELQDLLRASGKALVFVISPSKAETYPEFLPDWVRKRRKEFAGVTDLERLRRHLASSGVVYFDVPKYFQLRKETAPQKFYTRTGIHWNYFTAFHVWRELLQLVNREYGSEWPIPEQIGIEYDSPRGTDDDIAKLLNVFYLPGLEDPIAYPIVRTNALPEAVRPDFLFAGTSFSRTLVDSMYLSESGRDCDYLFYTERHLTFQAPDEKVSAGTNVDSQRTYIDGFGSIDWHETLFDKQIVVIELLETKIDQLSFGFPKAALAALKYRSPPDRLASRPD